MNDMTQPGLDDPFAPDRDDWSGRLAERMEAYRASDEYKDQVKDGIAEKLCIALENLAERGALQREVVVAVCCAAVEEYGAGSPERGDLFDRTKSDAEWWAECATQIELEVYLAAALRMITRRGFMRNAKLRVMAALWNSASPDDKQQFLERVTVQ